MWDAVSECRQHGVCCDYAELNLDEDSGDWVIRLF